MGVVNEDCKKNEESTLKGQLDLLEIIGVAATVSSAIIALLHYLHDIRKDRKQKSNHDRTYSVNP